MSVSHKLVSAGILQINALNPEDSFSQLV